jgi:hypothetical protein
MNTKTKTNCKNARGLLGKLGEYVNFSTPWIQRHIANCPKCQKRFASLGNVYLAMSLLKACPHDIDLLKRANIQTIDSLTHSVRGTVKADKLRIAVPRVKFIEKLAPVRGAIVNTAACLAIMCFAKAGILNSMEKFQTDSKKVIENYYEKNIGSEMTDEIFS